MASRSAGWRAVATAWLIALHAHPASAGENPGELPANAERVSLDQMSSALAEQLECLALNIYWEARSEPVIGQLAVAAVTLNRVADPAYPDSVCEVVYQGGEGGKKGCQFSWWCDGKPDRPRNAAAWAKAAEVALAAASMQLPDPTGGALWYHADYVDPRWARSKLVVARIGRHLFFRDGAFDDRLVASAR
jgi:spore germination cell wall hydrolase CwlJ-like protein